MTLPALTTEVVQLDSALVADRDLWAALHAFASLVDPVDWVLIGGQMVALHGYVASTVPPRATHDIDVVANITVERHALARCAQALTDLSFAPRPALSGKKLHRFAGDTISVDLLVPDHLPRHLAVRLLGHDPVQIEGGQRALDRAHAVTVSLDGVHATVPTPDLVGALVIKARAYVADSRDTDRHAHDLAFLCSLIHDPRIIHADLDRNERRYLRRADLTKDHTKLPWANLDRDVRADAAEAWETLTRT